LPILLKLASVTGLRGMPVYTSLKGRGLQLNSYNWAICKDLKLRKEEEGKGGEGELYI